MTEEANANIIDVSDATFEFDVIQRSYRDGRCGRFLGAVVWALSGSWPDP